MGCHVKLLPVFCESELSLQHLAREILREFLGEYALSKFAHFLSSDFGNRVQPELKKGESAIS